MSKLRPAIVLAEAGRGDWILCQLTSNPYGDRSVVKLDDRNLRQGSLDITSYARPGKLFTANNNLMVSQVATLEHEALGRIIEATVHLVRTGLTTGTTRHHLSVCFADITHWLKLTRAVGDERAVEVLQELLKISGDVILKHGGTIRKYIGDAVLFTFPTPQQAVKAAQEMVEHRKEVEGIDLRFHVAIATGEVLVTQIGHPSFLLEDVMGGTVNRAALLLREAGKTETGIAMCEETKKSVGMVE